MKRVAGGEPDSGIHKKALCIARGFFMSVVSACHSAVHVWLAVLPQYQIDHFDRGDISEGIALLKLLY